MPSAKDEALLKEIRDKHTYYLDCWRSIRDEAKKDMRYISGDPWDPKERAIREDPANPRPCLSQDELSQYVNQLINSVKQNKRSGKVVPLGSGANDKTAEFISAMIRGIEYKSNGQSAFDTAFENGASRSYGYFRITKQYISEGGFEQELVIKRIPNPDTVLMDPDCKQIDGSDQEGCFVVDMILKDDFRRRWPNADIQDFTPEQTEAAPSWVTDSHVQVAEYWKVDYVKRTLLLVQGANGPEKHFLDEIDGGKIKKDQLVTSAGTFPVLQTREVQSKKVVQYFTNGLEILDRTEWEGKYIPIVPVIGKEIFVDQGGGTKRVLLSLIRLARDPYMLYCYYRSCEAELVSITPKTPFVGAVGQFKTDKDGWATVSKVPHAYLQYDVVTDQAGNNPLPPPSRPNYEPAIQALEIGAEAARRGIQAAMGITPLPTAAQRQNEKSGVALQTINQQQSIGTFHFIANYDMSITHGYRILIDMIPHVYDTARQVGLVDGEGNFKVQQTTLNAQGNVVEHNGEHDVTIQAAPSYQSQRDQMNQFLETLAGTAQGPLIMDLLVKSQNLGLYGDKIAERLTPPQFAQKDGQEPLPAAAQQQIAQAHEVIQAGAAHIQQQQQTIQQLQQEKQAKIIENEYRLKIAQLDRLTKLEVAEITTKAQDKAQRDELYAQIVQTGADQAHEAGTQAADQAHELNMQDAAHANTQDLTTQNAAIAQQAQANQPQAQPGQ